jgi:hypothetical protein
VRNARSVAIDGRIAVMILHGFRVGSPVVTDTGCRPSAAPTGRPPGTFDHNPNSRLHRPCCMKWRSDDLELRVSTIGFSRAFSVSSSFKRLTSSAFSPPYWAHNVNRSPRRFSCFATSGISRPSASSRSASGSLRRVCSGCGDVASSESSCPWWAGQDSHTMRTNPRGSGHSPLNKVPVLKQGNGGEADVTI